MGGQRGQRWGQAAEVGADLCSQGQGEQEGCQSRPYLVLTVDLGPRVDQDLEDP